MTIKEVLHKNEKVGTLQLRAFDYVFPGDRVIIKMRSCKALALTILQCYERKLVTVLLDPKSTNDTVNYVAEFTGAKIIITENEFCKICVHDRKHLDKLVDPDDRFIIFTSGSTSDPKGVVLGQKAIEHNALQVAKEHSFITKNHATVLPLYHCNALCMSLIGTHLVDSSLLLINQFDPNVFFQQLNENNIATASVVPALLERLVNVAPKWPSNLEYLITAAAPLQSHLAKKFFELYGPKLRQGYGLSETVNFSFLNPLMTDREFHEQYLSQQAPVGLPLKETQARIVDGEVQIKGPNKMRCYWRNDTATQDSYTSDGYFLTGDLGHWRNKYLVLTGRKKEVINRGGETIYPNAVEASWKDVIKSPYFAFGVKNNLLEQDIAIWAEKLPLSNELFDGCQYIPSAVQTGSPPITPTGKPKRSVMAKWVSRSYQDHYDDYVKLRNYAIRGAQFVLNNSNINSSISPPNLNFILDQARALCSHDKNQISTIKKEYDFPASEIIFLICEFWEEIKTGNCNASDLLAKRNNLWFRLMHEWPMISYAKMAAQHLIDKELLTGKVLELGAGTGNTSVLIEKHVCNQFIRTDINPSLMEKIPMKGTIEKWDMNYPGRWENLDTVFGVNCLHCVQDKSATISYIYDMLKPGGTILLAEGAPTTNKDNEPWILNYMFGIFDGWWDKGGFLHRNDWIKLLTNNGFQDWGYSSLRAKSYDLGGVIWAKKP